MIVYTPRLVVYRRHDDLALHLHVDPSDEMTSGQVYDAEVLMPAIGKEHRVASTVGRWRGSRVTGVARGTASTLGFALPQLIEDHCVMIHNCAIKLRIYSPTDPEDATLHELPVDVEQREMAL